MRCEEVVSSSISTDAGVPQGIIFGPLLFALYIKDIGQITGPCEYHVFAEDTILYINANKSTEVVNTTNEDLNNISERLLCIKLKLNTNKTKERFFVLNGKILDF